MLNVHIICATFAQGGPTHRKKMLQLIIPPPPHRSKNIKSEYNMTCYQGKSETDLMLYTHFFTYNILCVCGDTELIAKKYLLLT